MDDLKKDKITNGSGAIRKDVNLRKLEEKELFSLMNMLSWNDEFDKFLIQQICLELKRRGKKNFL